MCGIVGVQRMGSIPCEETLTVALQALHHRGPDSHCCFVDPEMNIALGHCRLSIVGIDNGIQPLFSSDKSIVAVVNGEFYDYKAQKKSLENLGYKFSTETDSEIIIALYQEYAIDCLKHLNGEFAFILYDRNKDILFAARDRFGIKPLYYARLKDAIVLASEVKSLQCYLSDIKLDSIGLNNFYHAVH